MEIDPGTARVLELEALLSLWKPRSELARSRASRSIHSPPLSPTKVAAEVERLKALDDLTAGRALAAIADPLASLPTLEKTRRRLASGEPLTDRHLFEVKELLFFGLQVIDEADGLDGLPAPEGDRAAALRSLMYHLHPEAVPTRRFSLADGLDEELAEARREMRAAKKHARRLRRALEEEVLEAIPGAFDVHGIFHPDRDTDEADLEAALQEKGLRREGDGFVLVDEELAAVTQEVDHLQRRVANEEARHRQRLTEDLTPRFPELERLLEELVAFDLRVSRVELRRHLDGCWAEQAIEAETEQAWLVLENARDPLLGDEAQPIDVSLQEPSTILLGPNMGGKSSLLKLVGRAQWCAQRALPVPADRCRYQPLTRVLYVGSDEFRDDDQRSGLSSFGREVTRLVEFWEEPGPQLWLLDEPARGTHPDEGTRLARGIIDDRRARGDRLLVATHFPDLATDRDGLLQIQGLTVDDEELRRALDAGHRQGKALQEILQGLMDYRVRDVPGGEVPRDATRVARALGLTIRK